MTTSGRRTRRLWMAVAPLIATVVLVPANNPTAYASHCTGTGPGAPDPGWGEPRFLWPITGDANSEVQLQRHNPDTGACANHNGRDISNPAVRAEVRAARRGMVTLAQPADGNNTVTIMHDNGWSTCHLHMKDSEIVVSTNQVVEAGQLLGIEGCEGNCTGEHLHFEIRDPNGSVYSGHGWDNSFPHGFDVTQGQGIRVQVAAPSGLPANTAGLSPIPLGDAGVRSVGELAPRR